LSDFNYIRTTYKVPAEVGRRVRYTYPKPPLEGTIIKAEGAYLRILLDGHKRPGNFHPTWELTYLDEFRPVTFKPSRYDEYLRSESSLTFMQWLGVTVPTFRLDYNGMWVMSCTSWPGVTITGEPCRLKKDAKASYKDALKRGGPNRRPTGQEEQP
jgi:hypothetical protein